MLRKAVHSAGLARALSKSGYCSRSAAEKLVRDGRVRLNGRVIRDPEKPVALGQDSIEVDGHKLGLAKKLYLVLNKPRGIVTSARDEKGRETVYSLLPESRQWVAPVGRLDKASEGLLLLTNDSEWGARIASPETHIEKMYHVQIAAVADEELIRSMTSGVRDASGDRVIGSSGDLKRPKSRSFDQPMTRSSGLQHDFFLRVKRTAIVRSGKKTSWLEVVLDEGKNRQIRRLLAALGIEVLRLIRIAIGPLQLGNLPKGKIRELTQEEKAALDWAAVSSKQDS
jgi:23S rRNA pseudouridine2605 synthase